MKYVTVFSIAVCVLASLVLAGNVSAQDHAARATVPFNFNVGDKWLPAGEYSITSDMTDPWVISIRSEYGKVALLSVIAESGGQRLTSSRLVFRKYGDEYFLHEILCSVCGLNVKFPGSKHEKLVRKRLEAGLLSPNDVYLAVDNRKR